MRGQGLPLLSTAQLLRAAFKIRLDQELGRDLLFMDVDAIPLGVNFVTALHEAVAECKVLLAVIGPSLRRRMTPERAVWRTRTISYGSRSGRPVRDRKSGTSQEL
jgi:hypothetical protein